MKREIEHITLAAHSFNVHRLWGDNAFCSAMAQVLRVHGGAIEEPNVRHGFTTGMSSAKLL